MAVVYYDPITHELLSAPVDGSISKEVADTYLEPTSWSTKYCDFLTDDQLTELEVHSKYNFLLKFTSTERKAIKIAAATDSNISDFLMLLDNAEGVDLRDDNVIGAINYMAATGLIQSARVKQILGGV